MNTPGTNRTSKQLTATKRTIYKGGSARAWRSTSTMWMRLHTHSHTTRQPLAGQKAEPKKIVVIGSSYDMDLDLVLLLLQPPPCKPPSINDSTHNRGGTSSRTNLLRWTNSPKLASHNHYAIANSLPTFDDVKTLPLKVWLWLQLLCAPVYAQGSHCGSILRIYNPYTV